MRILGGVMVRMFALAAVAAMLLLGGPARAQEHARLVVQQSDANSKASTFALSLDGKYAVSGGQKYARLWETSSGRLVRAFPHKGKVSVAKLRADNARLATAEGAECYGACHAPNGTVHLWDTATGKELAQITSAYEDSDMRRMPSIEFSGDGSMLAAGLKQGLSILNSSTGEILHRFPCSSGDAHFVDHDLMVAAVCLEGLFAWKLEGDTRVWSRPWEPRYGEFAERSFLDDGQTLIVRFHSDLWEVRDSVTGALIPAKRQDGCNLEELRRAPGESREAIGCGYTVPSSPVVARLPEASGATRYGKARVEQKDGQPIMIVYEQRAPVVLPLSGQLGMWAVSPDGRSIVVSTKPVQTQSKDFPRYEPPDVLLWDVRKSAPVSKLEQSEGSDKAPVVGFEEGGSLAVTTYGRRVARWSVATGKPRNTLDCPVDRYLPKNSDNPSPEQMHFTGFLGPEGARPGEIVYPETASYKTLANGVVYLHCSRVAYLSRWGDREPVHRFDGPGNSVLFSTDERRMLVQRVIDGDTDQRTSKTAEVWDLDALREIGHLALMTEDQVSFAPDDRNIVIDREHKKPLLWDAASGLVTSYQQPVTRDQLMYHLHAVWMDDPSERNHVLNDETFGSDKFAGHEESVEALGFSADGTMLRLSGGTNERYVEREMYNEGDEWVWNTQIAQTVLHEYRFTGSARYSPDGQLLLLDERGGGLSVVEVGSGKKRTQLQIDADPHRDYTFSQDFRYARARFEHTDRYMGLVASVPPPPLHPGPDGVPVPVHPVANPAAKPPPVSGFHYWDLRSGTGEQVTEPAGEDFVYDLHDWRSNRWDDDLGDFLEGAESGEHAADVCKDGTQLGISRDGKRMVMRSKGDLALCDSTAKQLIATVLLRSPFAPGHLCFSPDGETFGVVDEATVSIWKFHRKTALVRVTLPIDSATAGAFSPNGRMLLVGAHDGTVRFVNVSTGQVMATLVTFRNYATGEAHWIVIDTEGRFDSDGVSGNLPMQWVLDSAPLKPIAVESLMRDYFTPGLLALLLQGKDRPVVPRLVKIPNSLQPDVRMVSIRVAPDGASADVAVSVVSRTDETGQSSGARDLKLFRDGQLTRVKEGAIRDGIVEFAQVPLLQNASEVVFSAYAFNENGIRSAYDGVEIEVSREAKTSAREKVRPRAFLLNVGVNHYADPGCELHDAAADAETMAAELRAGLAGRYELHEKVLVSPSGSDASGARRDDIRLELKAIADAARPDDLFLFSFSGHGYTSPEGEFYILPSSFSGHCKGLEPSSLSSAVSSNELADWLREIDAGSMTVILDACHSAESVEGGNFKPGPLGSRGLGQLAYDKRMRILAASQSDQVAHEYDSLGLGMLTYALTRDGLDTGKADWKPKDQQITLAEWLSYAADAVPRLVPGQAAPKSKSAVDRDGSGETDIQLPALFDYAISDTITVMSRLGKERDQ